MKNNDIDNVIDYWKRLVLKTTQYSSSMALIPFTDYEHRLKLIDLFLNSGFTTHHTIQNGNMLQFRSGRHNVIDLLLDMYIDGKCSKDNIISWITKSTKVNYSFYQLISIYELPIDEFIETLVLIKLTR